MSYSVARTAKALMLEPSELINVFEAFFRSATTKISEARECLKVEDFTQFVRKMHSLKGLALSLHMEQVGELAAQAERFDNQSKFAMQEMLEQLEQEVLIVKKTVDSFYEQ